jgi:hypothetical protein
MLDSEILVSLACPFVCLPLPACLLVKKKMKMNMKNLTKLKFVGANN